MDPPPADPAGATRSLVREHNNGRDLRPPPPEQALRPRWDASQRRVGEELEFPSLPEHPTRERTQPPEVVNAAQDSGPGSGPAGVGGQRAKRLRLELKSI